MANVFQRVVRIADGGASGFNCDTEVWWCPSVALVQGISPYVLTVSTNLSSNKTLFLKCFELTGLTGAVDQSGIANTSSSVTSAAVNGAGADGQAHDFVVTAITVGFGASAITDPATTSNPVTFTSGLYNATAFEHSYRINTTAVTDNASWTWTTANQYAAVIASFAASSAPTIVQNPAGTQVTSTSVSKSFPALPVAGHAVIAVIGGTPWSPSFQITNVSDNQVQAYVPLGGLGDLEYHYR